MVKQKRNKQRINPIRLIKDILRQPDSDFYRQPILHINCYGQVEIENYKQIVQYTQQEICLDMGLWKVSLFGDCLELRSASKGQLLVQGKVFRTEFLYDKEG